MGKESTRTRVALAEDHKLVRACLRRILEAEPQIELVSEAEDGREALRQALELVPDVMVMDIRMPLLNGIEATRVIRAAKDGGQECPPHILVVSLHCDSDLARQALEAGAAGIMLKEEAHDLVRATLLVARGEMFLSPKISAMLQKVQEKAPSTNHNKERLNKGERQLLLLLAGGASNGQIACQLQIHVEALDAHRRQILRKLSLHGASDLARLVEGE
jgi:two-component system response regulator NreC